MATTNQILANRLNAQKSTGPRTHHGKRISSQNALRSGIDARSTVIRGEHHRALEHLTAEYYQRWSPSTPEERFLVDTLITSEWFRRRYVRVEAQLWEVQTREVQTREVQSTEAGNADFSRTAEQLSRLQRRLDSAERNYLRALKELQRLESQREIQPEATLEPIANTPVKIELASFLTCPKQDPQQSPQTTPPTIPLREAA